MAADQLPTARSRLDASELIVVVEEVVVLLVVLIVVVEVVVLLVLIEVVVVEVIVVVELVVVVVVEFVVVIVIRVTRVVIGLCNKPRQTVAPVGDCRPGRFNLPGRFDVLVDGWPHVPFGFSGGKDHL